MANEARVGILFMFTKKLRLLRERVGWAIFSAHQKPPNFQYRHTQNTTGIRHNKPMQLTERHGGQKNLPTLLCLQLHPACNTDSTG
jgi:hypothetical protein